MLRLAAGFVALVCLVGLLLEVSRKTPSFIGTIGACVALYVFAYAALFGKSPFKRLEKKISYRTREQDE